jgi:hypothetical protein
VEYQLVVIDRIKTMIKSLEARRICCRYIATQKFVPKHDVLRDQDVEAIKNFLYDKPNILVLTGLLI